jgi:glutamate 5-kinase
MEKIIVQGEDHGTKCLPSALYYSSRDRWLVGGVVQKGSVTIDAKAAEALRLGKSLLPVGISEVEGIFQRGDAIRVLDEKGESLAVGLANYPSDALNAIKRKPSSDIEMTLGYFSGAEAIHKDNLALTSCTLTYHSPSSRT